MTLTKITEKPLHYLGEAESDVRKRSNKVLNYIIKRSVEPLGYEVVRADEISEPGTINLQVLKRIVDSEIVIADLTGTNPNVMYELAIRHAIRKPVILLISNGEKIPFDIAAERAIFYDLGDIESVDNSREELARQIQFIKTNEFNIDTPFSLIQGMISTTKSSVNEVDNWTIALDDIGFIKNAVRKLLDAQTEVEIARMTSQPLAGTTKWIKIRVEYPSKYNVDRDEFLEISSDQNIQNVLNDIYFLLQESKDSSFKPKGYTYLWDWVLIRKKDNLPLVIKGIQDRVRALDIFSDGETWQVVKLNEPLLNKAERFNLNRGTISSN
jgi:hypothetical protein